MKTKINNEIVRQVDKNSIFYKFNKACYTCKRTCLDQKEDLQIIFKNTSKVILQLRSSEVCQDFLPIWRILKNKNKQ